MIDALLPGKQGGNPGKVSGKMDFTKKSNGTENCEGFSPECINGVNFADLYARISMCNKQALVDDNTQECPQNEENGDCCEVTMETIGCILGLSGSELISQPLEDSGDTENAAATAHETGSELIIDALRSITELLGLPDRGIENLSIKDANESTIDELAEIVHVVEQITSALESRGNEIPLAQLFPENSSLLSTDNPDGSDIQSSVGFSSALKVELFKFQMGAQLLGISADVQAKVAELSQQSPMTGMNQAVDPSTILTSVEQIKNVFGKALAMVDRNDEGFVSVPGGGKTGITISEIITGTQESEQPAGGAFDTETYRALLKVDSKEKDIGPVTGEDQVKKDELVTVSNSDAAILQDSTTSSDLKDFSIAADVSNIKINTSQAVTQEKISSVLGRMTDETAVMEQISGKLTSVIRSGSNEVRIQLRPEALGEVNLQIKMEGDIVFAKIQVESQQVKQIVESNLQSLKDALAGQNLSSGSIDVSVGHEKDNPTDWDLQQHQQRQNAEEYHGGQHHGKNSVNQSRNEQILNRIDTVNRYGTNSIEYYA